MTTPPEADDRIPLFVLGTTLVRSRWRIARWAFVGGVIAFAPVINKPLTYRAEASFIPQGYDASRSGLAGLAGQFGINVSQPTTDAAVSPDFYIKLVTSRVVLEPIVRDTFRVAELGNKPRVLMDILQVPRSSPEARQELGIQKLAGMISTDVGKTTGIVQVNVTSEYRSLALELTQRLLAGLNEYNQRVRLTNAGEERRQIEARLEIANAELHDAQARLDAFNASNRNIQGSPGLQTQRDRLQRDAEFRQQIYTSLATSDEDARMREARDTPVISIFEPPAVPTKPQSRGRLGRLLFGLLLGTIAGVMFTVVGSFMKHRRAVGDADAADFVFALRDVRNDLLRPFRWARKSADRPPTARGQ